MRAPRRTAAPVIRFVFDTRVHQKLHSHSDGFKKSNISLDYCVTSHATYNQASLLEDESSTRIIYNIPNTGDPAPMTSPHGEAVPRLRVAPRLLDLGCVNSPRITSKSTKARVKHNSTQLWAYAQDYGPRVVWPPSEPEEGEQFDPEDALPAIRQSINVLNENTLIEPIFQEMCHFYLNFLNRVIYNYALRPERTIGWMLQRFKLSESAKLGMLCTAVLFRSNYERSMLTPSLYVHAKELYSLAQQRLPLDLCDPKLSTIAKLTSLTEIMNYEFYAGKLSSYYTHGAQAVPLVREVLGSNNIDLLTLRGEHTFDVRCFAWCDIFDSLATSRPTHFTYESDIECQGHVSVMSDDKGVEAIFGCPNVIAVLLARTTALSHAGILIEERAQQGMELEKLIRGWEFGLAKAKRSCLRVARVAVQEIWRHAAILYVHHAIFKSHPSNLTVQDSVENIIKISSTVPPGGNPDCFLQPTYFIAGAFATSQKDRYALKSRILGSGNERYLRDLAFTLEEIWEETDKTGRLSSWSKKPQSFVF